MNTPADRTRMLLDMRDDIIKRLKGAEADLDAVERLIAVQKEVAHPMVAASVEEIRQAAIVILKDHGEPMHRQMLLERMIEQDVHVGGKVPVNNLGSILSRFSKDFLPYGHGVWGLKNSAFSPSNGHVPFDIAPSDEAVPRPAF